MMKSNEWREWFLTSDGWVRGSVQLVPPAKKEIIAPPENWVLSGKWSERNSGPKYVANVFDRILGSGQTEESIKSLIEKYGDVPESLS